MSQYRHNIGHIGQYCANVGAILEILANIGQPVQDWANIEPILFATRVSCAALKFNLIFAIMCRFEGQLDICMEYVLYRHIINYNTFNTF